MATAVEMDDRDALVAHARELLAPYPTAPDPAALEIDYDHAILDSRTGRETWLVVLPGYGVLGMVD
jgi:hypothetical protein